MWEKNNQYQKDLEGQIEYNRKLRELDRQKEEEEFLLGMHAEREYQHRLKECLDNPEYERIHPMRRAMMGAQ